jgi:multicomponent Na+:H+ antiporter subunit G
VTGGWAVAADVLAVVLVVAGAGLSVLAAVGLLRFPDVLARMHAQTKPAVLGMLLVLAGVALHERQAGLTATLALVAAFQLLTAPVGAHMIGRAAYRAGDADRDALVLDETPPEVPQHEE